MRSLCVLVIALAAAPLQAVVVGQTDTFTTGSQNWNWTLGSVTVPSGGGPAGTTDRYLRVSSTGQYPLGVSNDQQWAGDYADASVTSIAVDLKNFGPTGDLSVRLFLDSVGSSTFASTTPIVIHPDGFWHHMVFSLAPSDLTVLSTKGKKGDILLCLLLLRLFRGLAPGQFAAWPQSTPHGGRINNKVECPL